MRPWTVSGRLSFHRGFSASALAWPLLVLPGAAQAQVLCEPPDARLVSIQGTVELKRAGTDVWTAAMLEQAFCLGDTLRTGAASRAALALANDSTLRVDQDTTAQLRRGAEEGRSLLNLLIGAIYFFSHRPRALEVDTPFVNAAAEGTEFLVRVGAERAEVVMLDGQVLLQNPQGELRIASGQAAAIPAGAAPAPMLVARPRDAVAWALYYPPILAELAGGGAPPRPLPPGLQAATQRVAANDYAGALAALGVVPEAARDARYYTYRAGVLLNVGRVEDAAAAIQRALALDPNAGEALAQRAIIQVVQNRRADALVDARRAVELRPDSSTAGIALSYALQANFQLEEARATLREAVERQPEDALAWARLAELEQMFGELGRSRDAAERAVALAPELARTQIVLGFAALTRIDIDQAKASFERAIALDSANPLPRLGLGLGTIRSGDLERGRKDIEIAAALDPNDSLIRSYLGKAYFEERRDPLDAEQYAIAKELDPNDPTPWFYDAIRLQTVNRPVEALRNIERSIQLNDNRAVYRSRLLLDEDLATRQTSLGRIYDDLGFEQLGLVESTKSLSLDPSNYSAHRFLSDSYAAIPRHEIARASELLQSQLLQPININPVQPSLPLTDLNVVAAAGPAEAAFNEFTPLFTRNNAQLMTTGVVGNNDTYGGEGVLTMLYDRTSLSVGGSAFDTDGFRDNNDDKTKLADVYGQLAVTPKINVQAEYRYRDTDQGDLTLEFDPDEFSDADRRDIKQEVLRLGARFAPAVQSDIIASIVFSSRDEELTNVFPELTADASDSEDGYQMEGQYIFTGDPLNIIVGGGFYDINVDNRLQSNFVQPLPCLLPSCDLSRRFDSDYKNTYAYTNVSWPKDLTWTFGLSYDDFKESQVNVDRINPKVGLRWNLTDWLQLRLAAFQTVKPRLMVGQTVEPTQIAGFNQFFDDFNGTKTTRYGAGIDLHPTVDLNGGFEVSHRDMNVKIEDPFDGSVLTENQDESLYRAYLYWTPHLEWALSAEVEFEQFDRQGGPFGQLPTDVDTLVVPVGVRYFSPAGVFVGLVPSFVYQDVKRPGGGTDGDDQAILLDATIGYRLPQRRGIFSINVSNLFDKSFNYQDENFRTNDVRSPRFLPERTILARLTVTF
jgi:tetratricopeptide (TPR) repeat protein